MKIANNTNGFVTFQLTALLIMPGLMLSGFYTPASHAAVYTSLAAVSSSNKRISYKTRKQLISYKVRKGDTVYSIARNFRVKVSQVRRWNSLRRNRIATGQRLRLYVSIRSRRYRRPIRSRSRHKARKYATKRSRSRSKSRSRSRSRSRISSRMRSNSRSKRYMNPNRLRLRSRSAAVVDLRDGVVLYGKSMHKKRQIASLTKLMTAMVVLDARLQLSKRIRVTSADKDWLRFSRSRLRVGTVLRRKDLLYMALSASENRATHALARTFPGGKRAFIRAMNRKARELKMNSTRFSDASGLSNGNVSTARDLVRMVRAAYDYPVIRRMTTSKRGWIRNQRTGRIIQFRNTNRLVRRSSWDINISKTGFINEAGYCLVMHANINKRPVVIVLLKSSGRHSKFGDANRIRRWITKGDLKRRARKRSPSSSARKYRLSRRL
ncbi:Murein-DD-endopeptidase [hydrothermal vent metagenome]|uniref:Murein-DD-endopeptidase n=1 Tax=hydrothermal vent metagenome TaxID=652676 RepID=A0A3B0XTN9_9ZZZZ